MHKQTLFAGGQDAFEPHADQVVAQQRLFATGFAHQVVDSHLLVLAQQGYYLQAYRMTNRFEQVTGFFPVYGIGLLLFVVHYHTKVPMYYYMNKFSCIEALHSPLFPSIWGGFYIFTTQTSISYESDPLRI